MAIMQLMETTERARDVMIFVTLAACFHDVTDLVKMPDHSLVFSYFIVLRDFQTLIFNTLDHLRSTAKLM